LQDKTINALNNWRRIHKEQGMDYRLLPLPFIVNAVATDRNKNMLTIIANSNWRYDQHMHTKASWPNRSLYNSIWPLVIHHRTARNWRRRQLCRRMALLAKNWRRSLHGTGVGAGSRYFPQRVVPTRPNNCTTVVRTRERFRCCKS
jgi:hypothetical protein